MKKFRVWRSYSMKPFTLEIIIEAETPEAASKKAEEELDQREDDIESNLSISELFDQEEVEEAD